MSSETRLRDAIEDSLKQLREQHAAALDAVVKTFIEAAVAECDAETAEARAQAETAARLTLETNLSKAREEAEAQLAEVRAELATETQHRIETSVAKAKAQADAAVAEALGTAREEAANARAEAHKMREEAASARAGAEKTLEEAANARAEAEKAREEAANTRAELDKAREEAAGARAEAAKALAGAVAEVRARGDNALAPGREADVSGLSRLLDAIRGLSEARSLTDVLDRLAEHVARETDRVAVLLVRGNQLCGWRLVGFGDAAPDARRIDLSLDGHNIVVEAVRSKMPKIAKSEIGGFDFAPLPNGRTGLAVPLEVGGRIVAVLYADDAGLEIGTRPGAWPEVVEILARYAARCLEAVTVWHTPGARQPIVLSSSDSEPTVMGQVS